MNVFYWLFNALCLNVTWGIQPAQIVPILPMCSCHFPFICINDQSFTVERFLLNVFGIFNRSCNRLLRHFGIFYVYLKYRSTSFTIVCNKDATDGYFHVWFISRIFFVRKLWNLSATISKSPSWDLQLFYSVLPTFQNVKYWVYYPLFEREKHQ